MLYIVGAAAAALFVFAFTKRNGSEPSNRNGSKPSMRAVEVQAAKVKAAARKVDSSAAAVEVALKPLMAA
jgi:hypothetical protein